MHRVWIVCRCGHEEWGETAADVLRLDRFEMLHRARCTACGTRGAAGLVALAAERPDDAQGVGAGSLTSQHDERQALIAEFQTDAVEN